MPTYARAFKISSTNVVHLGSSAEPYLTPSVYTDEEGVLSYYEVCEMLSSKQKTAKVYWDHVSNVPFAIISGQSKDSNTWVSFDDSQSARKKANYVKANGLGGVSIWSLDMDDFKGLFCNLGAFPIIETIKQELENDQNHTTQGHSSLTNSTNKTLPIDKNKHSSTAIPKRASINQKPEKNSNGEVRRIRLKATINRRKRLANNSNPKSFSLHLFIFIFFTQSIYLFLKK